MAITVTYDEQMYKYIKAQFSAVCISFTLPSNTLDKRDDEWQFLFQFKSHFTVLYRCLTFILARIYDRVLLRKNRLRCQCKICTRLIRFTTNIFDRYLPFVMRAGMDVMQCCLLSPEGTGHFNHYYSLCVDKCVFYLLVKVFQNILVGV